MPNYRWSGNRKPHYGLWEIETPPKGYEDVHVTMNFPKDTTVQSWTWPHVTLIKTGANTTHIYIKRDGDGYKLFTSNGGAYVPTSTETLIVKNVIADFRDYGTPCEYLGDDDGNRYVPPYGR